jgi:hypothetical protein
LLISCQKEIRSDRKRILRTDGTKTYSDIGFLVTDEMNIHQSNFIFYPSKSLNLDNVYLSFKSDNLEAGFPIKRDVLFYRGFIYDKWEKDSIFYFWDKELELKVGFLYFSPAYIEYKVCDKSIFPNSLEERTIKYYTKNDSLVTKSNEAFDGLQKIVLVMANKE